MPDRPERSCECGNWFVPEEADDFRCEECLEEERKLPMYGTEPAQEPSDPDELEALSEGAVEV
jgi:hypothetical protein